jgi:hypothetical protein
VNLDDEEVMGVNANIEMGLGRAVSLCDKCVAGVNDDAGGGYCPRGFVCPIEALRNREVREGLAGRLMRAGLDRVSRMQSVW